MKWETYNFTNDFQDAILAALITYPDDFYSFGEIIKAAYFNGPAASELVFRLLEYKKKYGKYPTFTTLGNFAFHKAARANIDHAKETLDYVEKLAAIDVSDKQVMIDLCLEFAKERAIYDGIRKIHAAQSEGKMEEVRPVEIMQEAMAVGTNYNDLGVSVYHHPGEIIRKVMDRSYGVKTGYASFDKLWPLGWAPGWLIVLLAPPKRFKCEHPDTEILMFDGTVKRICEVKIGDKIMGDDAKPRNVLSCGYGHGPMYRVTQANGDHYTVNSDHILCLKRQPGTEPVGRFKNRYHTGSFLEMTAEEYARQPNWFQRTWKGYKVGVEFPAAVVPLDPYFMGLWLGDGNTDKASITIGDADPEIIPYLHQIARAENTKTRVYRGKTKCSEFHLTRRPGVQKNPVTAKLRALGVCGSKHVPSVYKINNRANRLQLLAGLLDSDGSHCKNRGFIFVNINEQLCQDTCWVARSLGFKAYVRKHKTRCKAQGKYVYSVAYRTYIQGRISEIPTKIARKRGVDSTKASDRTAIKVKPVGAGQWFGIEIDGNRKYLHSDFTVTHNTAFAINLALQIASQQDCDVLYYACEISQELAGMRALTNITGWTQDDFYNHKEKGIQVAERKVKEKLWGTVWFKGYPAKSTSISEIKAHAHQVINIFGLRPKAIVIDYAETVRPDSVDKKAPDWRQQADIYTQARAMGAEFGCTVIMPDRCNRETVGKKVPSMKSFQGAFEKAGIVDAAVGLCATDDELKHDRVRYFVFLNRHGEALKHYDGTIDPARMIMTVGKEIEYNPDEDEEGGDMPKRKRGGYVKRKMAAGAEDTQRD